MRDRLDHRSCAGGEDLGRRSVDRGRRSRPAHPPPRTPDAREGRASERTGENAAAPSCESQGSRHVRAYPVAPSFPSPLLSRSLARSRSANPSVLRRFSSSSPGVRPFWRVTYRSPSLSSVKRSVGRPFLSSLLRRLSARGSPKVFAPHDGGAKQFFVGAEAACRACIGAVQ